MKFSDGFWQLPAGSPPPTRHEARDIVADPAAGTLDRLRHDPPHPRARRHPQRPAAHRDVLLTGARRGPARDRPPRRRPSPAPAVRADRDAGFTPTVAGHRRGRTSDLRGPEVSVRRGVGWHVEYRSAGRLLTASTSRSVAAVTDDAGRDYVHEQLTITPGELDLRPRRAVRTGGQERPERRHLERSTAARPASRRTRTCRSTSAHRGYGVLVDHPGKVSFEVGSEAVERIQFSVPGRGAGVPGRRRPDAPRTSCAATRR